MTDNRKILFGVAGATLAWAGYKYYKASSILRGAMFTFKDIMFIGVKGGVVTLGVRVDARATGRLTLSNLSLLLYVNGLRLGRLYLPYQQDLEKGEKTILFYMDVKLSELSSGLLNTFVNKNVMLSIEGYFFFAGLPIAFPNINVLTSDINSIYEEYLIPVINTNFPAVGRCISSCGDVSSAVDNALQYVENEKIFYKNGLSKDIIKAMNICVNDSLYQTKDIAEALVEECRSDNKMQQDFAVCSRLFEFCEQNFRYELDPSGEQWIKNPSRFLSDGTGDCKAYAIFMCSVLSNAHIINAMRFVDFGQGDYRHVYPIVVIGDREIALDVVAYNQIGTQPGMQEPFTDKKDVFIYKQQNIHFIY